MTRPIPTRELILNALKTGDKCVREITKEINRHHTYIGNVLTRLCTAYEVETYQKFDHELGRNVSYYTLKKIIKHARTVYFSKDAKLQKLQKATDALNRSNQSSGKSYVSGATLSGNC